VRRKVKAGEIKTEIKLIVHEVTLMKVKMSSSIITKNIFSDDAVPAIKNATKRIKYVKTCFVDGVFPELLVKNMNQQGRGEGGNIRVACANAVRDLLKKPALRGRRITAAKFTVAFGSRVVDENPEIS
jgi:hypothetical protein